MGREVGGVSGCFGERGDDNAEMCEFGKLVLEIPGVSQVGVTPYSILVGKATAFEWDEVDGSIQDLLLGFSNSQRQLKDATGPKSRV